MGQARRIGLQAQMVDPADPGQADQRRDRQARAVARTDVCHHQLHRAAAPVRLSALSRQFGVRDHRGHHHHAADQFDGGVRALDLRISGPQCRHGHHHRHADDPDHRHPGAGLSRGDLARPDQFAVGGDPAGGGDADRRVPAAPIHDDLAPRPDRGGAHGQGVGMADLYPHRAAAVAAGARRACDLLGDVALERIPLAAGGSHQERELHPADRAQFVPGRVAGAVALSAGDDHADAAAGIAGVRVPATVHHRPASQTPA